MVATPLPGAALFQHPSWLAAGLVLAPLAGLAVLYLLRRTRRGLRAWAAPHLWSRLLPHPPAAHAPARAWLLALAVLTLCAGLASPRRGEGGDPVPEPGGGEARRADVVLVVDTSLSMAAPDAAPSRLFVARSLARRLAAALPGHRQALVATEGQGLVLAPLTRDAAMLALLLDTLEPGTLPLPGTHLAGGLEAALRLFPDAGSGPPSPTSRQRVVVLLSDGEDHQGGLERAARRCREAGAVVHAVGVGTARGGVLPLPPALPTVPGMRPQLKLDAGGRPVISRLREAPLRELARSTGGTYLHAADAGLDLGPMLRNMAALPGGELTAGQATGAARPRSGADRFQIPLAMALTLLLLERCLATGLVFAPFRSTRLRPTRLRARAGLALLTACALVSLGASTPSERTLFELTQEGIAALDGGNLERAVALFDLAREMAQGMEPEPSVERSLPSFNAGTAHLLATLRKGPDGAGAEAAALLREAGEAAGPELAPDAFYNLGNALLAVGEAEPAIAAYERSLRHDPEHADARHNLEIALARQQQQQPPPPSDSEGGAGAGRGRGGAGTGGAGGDQPGPDQPSETAEGEGEPPDGPSGYRPQPDLPPAQARALLASAEDLERQQRQEAGGDGRGSDEERRAREEKARAAGEKDW